MIDGETGFLADGFEVEDIVKVLRRAIQNQDDWKKLITNGRSLLLNNCTESEIMRRILKTMNTGADIRRTEGARIFRNYRAESVKETPETQTLGDLPSMDLQIGPKLSHKKVVYPLQVNNDELKGLHFYPGTFSTQPIGEIKFSIYIAGYTQPLREVKLDLADLHDNQWAQISFEPVLHSKGKRFRVAIEANISEGWIALYENSPANLHRWAKMGLRIERRIRQYITIPFNRPLYAFFPIY